MFKKTLLASALTLTFALGAQGVQANPVTNLVDGLLDGFTSHQLDARRGGGARRTKSVKRSSTTSSSSSTAAKPASTSLTNTSTTKSTTPTTTNSSTANNSTTGTNQQDANFSQRAYTGNQPANQPYNNQYGNQPYGNQPYGNQYGGQMGAAPGSMGMGSTFLSSLAGAGAGVLLANMLLSPAAAEEQGTEVATPDMLSDDQIKECLAELETSIEDAETRLKEASEDEKAAISDELSKLHALQVSLMKEQINRIQNS